MEKNEKKKLRRRMRGWTIARKSVKSTQFNTRTPKTGRKGVKIDWIVETVENTGTGWALGVRREGATIKEDAILWNTGDVEVTSSPDEFLKWQGDRRVQIVWKSNGRKDYATIKEITWKMTECAVTDWDPKNVRSTDESEESVDNESEDGSIGQRTKKQK